MSKRKFLVLVCLLLMVISAGCRAGGSKKIVIAHRGASGYLPEHTLESKAMAYSMGPDFIEQDLALTKDNRAVVIHDHYLDTVSNVASLYSGRKRRDGRYYVIDFTLAELKKLTFHERIDLKTGRAVYPERFPVKKGIDFKIHTLEEEIELIQGLNKSTGKNIGIYPELKAPWFHMQEGRDIAKIVLEILDRYGYNKKESYCYVQCFDPVCLKYLKNKLKTKLRLVQLIADNSWDETPGVNYDEMLTADGLADIKKYSDGVGPWINKVVIDRGRGKAEEYTDFIKLAHQSGLEVHPYTFRKDSLPSYVNSLDELFDIFINRLGADGVFTDFPDMGVDFIRNN